MKYQAVERHQADLILDQRMTSLKEHKRQTTGEIAVSGTKLEIIQSAIGRRGDWLSRMPWTIAVASRCSTTVETKFSSSQFGSD